MLTGLPVAGLAVLLTVVAAPAPAAAAEGTVLGESWPSAVTGSYIVALHGEPNDRSAGRADALASRVGGQVGRRFTHAMHGFVFHGNPTAARRLAADPAVARVTQNQQGRLTDYQRPVPAVGRARAWGLDRIDQRTKDLDDTYVYGSTADRVTAYVVDSGIRFDHVAFYGEAVSGYDAVDRGTPADDCNGHGTHVASILGASGRHQFQDVNNVGVAKAVNLVAVRVTNCDAFSTSAIIIDGIDWVIRDHDPGEVAVANISLGYPQVIPDLDNAVQRLIADGVTTVVAAGNENTDACTRSPARVPAAITVGATHISDERAWYSNHGSCLDLFAPGSDILGAASQAVDALATSSGTSQAAPHVAGAAALVLAAHPDYTPAQVAQALVSNATTGAVVDPRAGSPNRLLYVVNEPEANRFAMRVNPTSISTTPGGTVTVTVHTTVAWGRAERVTLTGFAPPGVTAVLDRSSMNAGNTATLSVTLPRNAPIGSAYQIEVVGHAPSNDAAATVTVTTAQGSNGCLGRNPNRIQATPTDIYGNGVTYSEIVITGCTAQPSPRSAYDITVITGCRQVLHVSLYAPDGSEYVLKDQDDPDDCDDNWVGRGTKNLSREIANGTWRLVVRSHGGGEVRPWTLNLNPAP